MLDELGGAIVGATVTAIDGKGVEKTVVTNDGGSYTINGLAPGKYTVRAINAGFAMSETPDVEVVAGKAQQFDITLKVAIEEQKVTVATDNRELSTEPENNAGAVVLKGDDIDALPDDPDDLAAALAGFSWSFRWSKRRSDFCRWLYRWPFAAARFDSRDSHQLKSVFCRIRSTRFWSYRNSDSPGTDRYRGQVSFNFNDDALNSRNPFADSAAANPDASIRRKLWWPNLETKSLVLCRLRQARRRRRSIDRRQRCLMRITISSVSMKQFPIPSRRTSFSPQNRLSDQSQQHAGRSLQLFEEHSRDRASVVSRCLRALTTRRTANRVFSLPKRRSSTRRSSTRRASSLNIKPVRRMPTIRFRLSKCRTHSPAADRRWASHTARRMTGS